MTTDTARFTTAIPVKTPVASAGITEYMETRPLDDIERALTSYVHLPEVVDLTLRPDGITVHTSDFPKLILESTGLDLRNHFAEAFRNADFISPEAREKLVADLFSCLDTVQSFVSDVGGVKLVRREKSSVDLPPGLSADFVQRMEVDTVVTFRLDSNSPDEVVFSDVTGIAFAVGGKLIGLARLELKVVEDSCLLVPTLDDRGTVERTHKNFMQALKSKGKDLIVHTAMKLNKLTTTLPVVREEFRQCVKDAMNFKLLLREADKDLILFIERCAGICVIDPLTRSLLTRGVRVVKTGLDIELERTASSVCDLGGIFLDIAPTVKLVMQKDCKQVRVDKLSGIGVDVAFDPPAELGAIGVDLQRSLPKKIVSLDLGERDADNRRRLVVSTAPGCWMSLDLNYQMQPATDANGDWVLVGVASNPISGVPQKFFLRMDRSNNLNMTPREIAEVVTQTALEGFDPADPYTWTWGAVALGGHALLAADEMFTDAVGDNDELKKAARRIGRFIGKLLNDW